MNREGNNAAWLLLSLAALCWAGNYVVGRGSRGEIGPITLAFWRDGIAFLVALPFAWRDIVRHRATLRREWATILVLGTLGVGGYHVCVYLGLARTEALNASVMLSAMPITIALGSWLFLAQRIGRLQGFGMALSLLGVAVVVLRGDPATLATFSFNTGDLWMLAAVPLWAAYTVILQRRPLPLPSFVLLTATLGAGVLAISPLYAWAVWTGEPMATTLPGIAALLYVALFATLIGYWCWNLGVERIGASRAGSFIHLTPIFAAILAILLLGERLETYHLAAGVLVFAGVLLAGRGRKAAAPAKREAVS
ncbi:MAG: DMT family transporter [Alphaproteobacteria bacterium]